MATSENSITQNRENRQILSGRVREVKRFKFPVRTTPVGSIDPYDNKPDPIDINSQMLFTEEGTSLPSI